MNEANYDIYSGDDARDRLVKSAIDKIGHGKPIVIINLLRFRESADYQGLTHAQTSELVKQEPHCSGPDAYYKRYVPVYNDVCKKYFGKEHGASQKILYLGKEMLPLLNRGRVPVEEGDERYWHAVIMLRYPSLEAAMQFIKTDEYWQANVHRVAALEDNVAWVTEPIEVAT
ncbi:hypothetical protein BDY17DRAFT_309720 [Neohortaea acidophila]|uniref:Uncharacterized protein n=1 Tax=Neohortaea acidophila TaxID=245834 RepID=A0A6A6PWU0_9PEZI|nr:uncharacterized protein BDY17DRAFT_309720 [Neohortaea acidophila]KAF2484502.1 hypothetical protein BDY17DRAFT_309720 [Neohortaea acidophila]